MATFEVQVEGLTGLDVDTSPTTGELTTFLTDGVKDVINKISKVDPLKLELFTTSATDSDNSGTQVDSGIIINVVRADGTTEANLYPASKILPQLKFRSTDTTSLHYKSNFNPGYYIENGTLFVVPAPSNATTNKAVVTHVAYPTVAFGDSSIGTNYRVHTAVSVTDADPAVFTCGETITLVNGDKVKLSGFTTSTDYNGVISEVQNVATDGTDKFRVKGLSSSGVGAAGTVETVVSGFPDEYEYLVVMYAGIKALDNALSAKTFPDDITFPVLPAGITLSIVSSSLPSFTEPVAFVPPASLSTADVSFSEVGTFPTFVKPIFSAPTLITIAGLTLPSKPIEPILNLTSITPDDFSQAAPTYTGPIVAPDFSDASDNWLVAEEDSEMVTSRVQIISAQIQEYQASIQNAVNVFNKENAAYQAQLQISIQNAQLENQDDGFRVQRWSTEVQAYQAEVNAAIQEWTAVEWTQKFQKYSTDYGQLLAEYGQNIQAETARIQNGFQEYQQKVDKSLQTYQIETGYDVSRQTADLQSSTQRFTQDLAKENASYQSELTIYTSESTTAYQENQSKIGRYSSVVQAYQTEVSSKIQDYTAKIQKASTDYQWMAARQQGLKQEYVQAFSIMTPASQQKRAQQPQQQARG